VERLALPPKTIKYIAGCDPCHNGFTPVTICKVYKNEQGETITEYYNKPQLSVPMHAVSI